MTEDEFSDVGARCEYCDDPLPPDVYGWCATCDTERKANGECPFCVDGGYGAFPGGDPRRFFPDPECSTPEERQAHKEACAAWDRGERPEIKVSGIEDGAFVERSSFGLGVYNIPCELHEYQ